MVGGNGMFSLNTTRKQLKGIKLEVKQMKNI